MREGVLGDSIYILLKGGVEIESRGEKLEFVDKGWFGEETLLQPRPVNWTTVYVRTSEAQVLRLLADDYDRIHRAYSEKKQASFSVGQKPSGNGYLDWPIDELGRRDRLITRPILTHRAFSAYQSAEKKAKTQPSPYNTQVKPPYKMSTNPCVKRTEDMLQMDAQRFAAKYNSRCRRAAAG